MSFYPAGKFTLSFELFPPKTAASEAALYENVEHLMAFGPDVITCTYGAGGSTQKKTLEITSEVKRRFGVRVASHLTCVGSTVDQLREYLKEASGRGVDNIVALRGDPPKGQQEFVATVGGLRYANELLGLIRKEFPSYGVAVAGYPETHQEAPSFEVDMQNLQRKVAAGADCVITQLFYDNADFFRFRAACEALDIRVPIIPGILPVTNLGQIQRITTLCKAKLPKSFTDKLAKKDDADWQFQVGVEFATQQVQELIDRGIPGIHFYVLNKSPATSAVLKAVKMSA
jgi:methylenetetrahydrofolate reductase (NADPH)